MSQPQYSQQMSQPQYSQPQPARVVRELTDEEIDERAVYDAQTRASNLRHTIRLARQEIVRSQFFGRSMSLIVVALDDYRENLDGLQR